MDKKTIMAFVVIGVIILLMPYYEKWMNPVDEQAVIAQETTTYVRETPQGQQPEKEILHPEIDIQTRDIYVESKDIIIANEKYVMILSNLGGGTVRKYELKGYKDLNGNSLNLLPLDAAANLNISFTNIYQDESNLDYIAFDCPELDNMVWGDTIFIDYERTLTFNTQTKDGVKIKKVFTFFPDRYDFQLDVTLADYLQKMAGLKYSLIWEDGFVITEKSAIDDIMYSGVYAQMGTEMAKIELRKAKIDEPKILNTDGQTDWVVFKSKYFTGFMAPLESKGIRSELGITKGKDSRDFTTRIDMRLSKGNYQQDSFMIGLLPGEKNLLSSYNIGLEKTMNWGGPIIKPFSIALLWLLQFFYRLVPNYGVVILIISVVIKIITFPLTHKSYSSMKRMQLLQPKIKELQAKYSNNKQQLQQKTMELYKKEKVNPMGGCLPMLLQLPLLYGLFVVFRTAIEFRGAPFMLWMKDLSAPDAMFSFGMNVPLLGTEFNLLPILMTVLMVIQQRMSGTGGGGTEQQAQQQKMMMWLMPAMMFFLFYKFSSGLVLYYLTFNALTILQQKFIINKSVEKQFVETHPGGLKVNIPKKK